MKKISLPDIPCWLELYANSIKQSAAPGRISRFQGSANAAMFMAAPLPTQEEVNANYCWCNPSAVAFFNFLTPRCSVTPDDFLIIPPTFRVEKPLARNIEFSLQVIKAAINSREIKKFVCIGKVSFKVLFGLGQDPPATLLAGRAVKSQLTDFKPLFVFPDVLALVVPQTLEGRFYFMAKAKQAALLSQLEAALPRFKEFLED